MDYSRGCVQNLFVFVHQVGKIEVLLDQGTWASFYAKECCYTIVLQIAWNLLAKSFVELSFLRWFGQAKVTCHI